MEQLVGDGQPEHRIAEKLEALVGRKSAMLVGVAAVGQCQCEQLIGQLDAECHDQRFTLTRSRALRRLVREHAGDFGPPRIHLFMVVPRFGLAERHAAFGAQAGAVVAAHR